MASARKTSLVLLFILGIIIFGYSQYASALQIEVSVTQSELLNEDEDGANHDIELEFDNPSLLLLNAGETEFLVITNDEVIGNGQLEPFTLQPLSSSYVQGIFHTDPNSDDESESMKLTGTTKYDIFFTSLDIPFVYYPTPEQAREFIHHD